MSAWIVSKVHIDAMVQAGLSGPGGPLFWYMGDVPLYLTRDTADRVGQMLWAENYASVNFRYDEDKAVPEYRFERTQDFTAVEMLKAIDCYEYQSCEHEGWERSEAHLFCEALRSILIGRLPGYKEAPWGIDERGVAPISLFDMARNSRR